MSTSPKSIKNSNPWFQCEKCSISIVNKNIELHVDDCPPDLSKIKYNFIQNETLYGEIDIKVNEDIKSLSTHDKDNMIFLSQPVIQLCSLSIGSLAVLKPIDESFIPVVRTVWPTTEKHLTSVLITKNSLDLLNIKTNSNVTVRKAICDKEAKEIVLVLLDGPKLLEFNKELINRLHKLYLNRLLTQGNQITAMYYGKLLKFEIKTINCQNNELNNKLQNLSINDVEFYKIVDTTKWILFKNEVDYSSVNTINKSLPKICGLQNEINEIRHLMQVALGKIKSNFNLSKGVLLYGTPGTGKTLLAKTLANESDANVCFISPSNFLNKTSDTLEEFINKLQDLFEHTPSMLIIDEIDVLYPLKPKQQSEIDKRIAANILEILDNINNHKIFVIATTNKLDALNTSLRKNYRLEKEIEIPIPNPKARFEILNEMLKITLSNLKQEEIEEIAFETHGFVGSDLYALYSQAALIASQRNGIKIEKNDFKISMTHVKPSAMREVQVEVANIKWSDIGGQKNLKLILQQAVEWPLKFAESFKRLGITPPRGVLMYGPPGCSKTMIAKALATESRLNFLSIKGPELFSKWVGESERAIREVFRKARQVAPSIIFFDEIDALGCERTTNSTASVQERVLAQLLTELDGISPLGDVTVLAATNRPDRIDKALTRPGRLDRIVYVPLPDSNTRRAIFNIKIAKMSTIDIDIENLVESTSRYSGAEIVALCHEAAMIALEENIEASHVKMSHFLKALKLVKPRTSDDLLKIYNDYQKNVT